jgi:hypothetical protein
VSGAVALVAVWMTLSFSQCVHGVKPRCCETVAVHPYRYLLSEERYQTSIGGANFIACSVKAVCGPYFCITSS